MKRVTFLGLGTMGLGMVKNLLSAGHDVTVWNRSANGVDEAVGAGANFAPTITGAVKDADFVLYCLSDDDAVREVVQIGRASCRERVF